MTGLETAAVIVAIVFMGMIMVTLIVIIFAALAISKKVSKVTTTAQLKLDMVGELSCIVKRLMRAFTKR